MSARSELVKVMEVVSDASRSSLLEVTQAGIQSFDFIEKHGKSILATMVAFDKLHREHYAKERTTDDR